jgi:hypothetical protein
MSVHNYMLEDVLGALRASLLFPLFVVAPGYVAAWFGNLFGFRGRTFSFRLALSAPLSISICPILTFLTGRFVSMTAVWALYAITAVAFFFLLLRDRNRLFRARTPAFRVAAPILAAWFLIAFVSLVDLQIGNRLYLPTGAIDHSLRTALVQSISITGVPPSNPFFQPGHPVPLRYHYFWLLICSLVERLSNGSVGPRQVIIGGTVWIGAALIGILSLYLRLFTKSSAAPYRRRFRIGAVLLAITGLDIIPALFFFFLYARGLVPFVTPSIELWNEHVEWFLSTTLSTPHAIAALIACFTAFLLLWHAGSRPRYIPFAALSLATAVGASLYVAFVFALFLALWTAYTLYLKRYPETLGFCLAGAASLLLVIPYLRDMSGPGLGGPLFSFTVREFSLAALVPTGALPALWRRILVNGALLPLNYFLEFGLFFFVARYKWLRHRATGEPFSRQDVALATMASVSALVCTFLRSSVIGNNDLGWRGFLIAQFALLLWAVDIFGESQSHSFLTAPQKQALAVCFGLGFAGTVTDLTLMRTYPVLADRGVVPPLDWMAPDRDFGRRAYAARNAYDWVRATTPPTASVQANPLSTFQDTFGMTYGQRPTVAGDRTCLTTFGGDPAQCPPIFARVEAVFPSDAAAGAMRDVCRALPVNSIVVKDVDPVWTNPRSWIWTEQPAYSNAFVRIFQCSRPPL